MKSDLTICNEAKVLNIYEIAKKANICEKYIEPYGLDKAKINLNIMNEFNSKKDAKLVLVTAISPTPLGEGKTTTSIGLVDSLNKLNINTIGALREPSLGPVFGVKGGACGGGYAQVNPMADINLHFTGDLHAITSANNLISACIDNHIYQGNELNIDPDNIVWQRCLDLNDRALRNVMVGRGKKTDGVERPDKFNISVASEIMAILCLSSDLKDLERRVNEIIIGYTFDNKIVKLKELGISGSVVVLLKDAIKPNLIQTLENNPIIMHGGPFANIAHGCNSILATRLACKLADVVVTEAGFGSDLGCEKFINIKTRVADLGVSCVVLVATIKALKYHGGMKAKEVLNQDNNALIKGLANLDAHIKAIKKYNLNYVVAINKFPTDTKEELEILTNYLKENGHEYALSEIFAKGSNGGEAMAKAVLSKLAENTKPQYTYQLAEKIETKIEKIAKNVYGASNVVFNESLIEKLKYLNDSEYKDFFICMAKTPLSLSDDKKKVGAPKDFTITINEIRISAGAKFLVCLTGDVMTMPGLPKEPLAKKIRINDEGIIENLS